jgi:transcriptional regulator with XRE-family HTH domain
VRKDPVIPQVAASIERARTDAGLSQVELARRSGLDLRTITRIESVQREPSISTVVRLARGLGLTVSVLLDGIE